MREHQLLVNRAERRFRAFRRSGIPFRQVEAGRDTHIPTQSRLRVALQSHTTLAPGGWNDGCLDEVAEHAVVPGGFVILVEHAARNKNEPGPRKHARGQVTLDIGLLDLDLARVLRRRHSMFQFQLAHKASLVVELVPRAEYEAGKVRLSFGEILARPCVGHFAVAEEVRAPTARAFSGKQRRIVRRSRR